MYPLYLALVPRKIVADEAGDCYWPDLPQSILDRSLGWGQASSQFNPYGKQLVWLRATDEELLEIESRGGKIMGQAEDSAKTQNWIDFFNTHSPQWDSLVQARASIKTAKNDAEREKAIQDYDAISPQVYSYHKAALNEFTTSYRSKAERLESVLAAHGVAPFETSLWQTLILENMATLSQDNFNRSDRDLAGDTMSDGVSTWMVFSGAYRIVSNQATGNTTNWMAKASTNGTDMRTSITYISSSVNGSGPACRGSNSGSAFSGYRSRNNLLERVDSGSATTIASGTAYAQNDIAGVEGSGTTINRYLNGSVSGTTTDATYSSGFGGTFNISGNTRTMDNFLVESLAAAGPTAPQPANIRRRNAVTSIN